MLKKMLSSTVGLVLNEKASSNLGYNWTIVILYWTITLGVFYTNFIISISAFTIAGFYFFIYFSFLISTLSTMVAMR